MDGKVYPMSEIDRYDYPFPRHLVAQFPSPHRADARLIVADRATGGLSHKHIRDLPELLRPGDCLVLNDTRVVPARLVGRRALTGGRWEGLFLGSTEEGLWSALSKCRGKIAAGEYITLLDREGRDDIRLSLAASQPGGVWVARPETPETALAVLERVGRVPLPPYIRKGEMVDADRERYQTVYARNPGSVAAPTAGLHLTLPLIKRLEELGVAIAWLTLHVGAGTFRPIASDSLADHKMHSEWAHLDPTTVEKILECRKRGGRVVAVGTTSVRVLETAALGGALGSFCGPTDLFIRPPFQFRAVDALLTNFHLPRTTLLVLVRTFGGESLIGRAYAEAIAQEYRFFSYGDAMLIL
jgi:S-adenosylmethionine:tRNA ribosyltransferase-isomerase